jgi:hypothetical protein
VAADKLKRLPIGVSSRGAGTIAVRGVITARGGRRLGSFKPVRWEAAATAHRRLHLRIAGNGRWTRRLKRRGVTARINAVFKASNGVTRKTVAKVRVRR